MAAPDALHPPRASPLHLPLSLPRLPERFQEGLEPLPPSGWQSRGWPATLDVPTRLRHLLAHPQPPRAWVGLCGHGTGRLAAVLAVASAEVAVFVRRWWPLALGPLAASDAPGPEAHRLAGSWVLVEHLIDGVDQACRRGLWPAGLRLTVIDDDAGPRRWGWLAPSLHDPAETGLAADPMALLRAVAATDQVLMATV